ncbi:MAG: HAMP domain-containing histidine kinase [Lachnospiraceae bacterium]|nr:HAMP domain-containing histidine kinase [Lachnospiraceae bacterium]
MQGVLRRLDAMLEKALRGEFTEESFDESKLSRFESKLAKYLLQNRLTKASLLAERDSIEKMVQDISHQTKTPIANIMLYTELLAEQPLDAEERQIAEHIAGQTERLKFITDALVKVSRLENGIIQVRPSVQSLLPLVEDVVEEYENKAGSKGLQLSIAVKTPAPEAYFDYKWTREALANIVDNAIKYTQESGRIEIAIVPYELYHMIEVRDNGMGIAESEQAQIFQRFYRGSSAHAQEGVGIGLYLAREIVTKEGGYIRVRSREGAGAAFGIFLRAQ